MNLKDFGVKRFGNYKDYMADVKRELAKEHKFIVGGKQENALLDGQGREAAPKIFHRVMEDVDKLSKRVPGVQTYPKV